MADTVPGFDGAPLAVHRIGAGRPVIMLHGLFSSAEMNWIKWGHAQLLAEAGFEAIMPDLRGHGQSTKPHDPAAWPAPGPGFRISWSRARSNSPCAPSGFFGNRSV